MVVGAVRELAGPMPSPLWSNAFVQSALVDLRALIGFLLADADDIRLVIRPADVKPSWYLAEGEIWVPPTQRRRRALYAFYDAVGGNLAHLAVKSVRHPGAWPIAEATAVVLEDLGQLLVAVLTHSPTEAKRFDGRGDRLTAVIREWRRLDVRPYPTPPAEKAVARARRLLRTQLGWPSG